MVARYTSHLQYGICETWLKLEKLQQIISAEKRYDDNTKNTKVVKTHPLPSTHKNYLPLCD